MKKKCWNCNDPLPEDTNIGVCLNCQRQMRAEDIEKDEICPDDPILK